MAQTLHGEENKKSVTRGNKSLDERRDFSDLRCQEVDDENKPERI